VPTGEVGETSRGSGLFALQSDPMAINELNAPNKTYPLCTIWLCQNHS
jgi:hypothetical protein